MELPRRGDLARFAAPAAFLLAVTVAVLLVRAGFEGGSDSRGSTTALTTTHATVTTTTATTATTATQPAKRYYTIQVGDTRLTGKGKLKKEYQTPYGVAPIERYVYQSSRGGRSASSSRNRRA